MKRDKWFLNSPSKWNMLKWLKNIYDWYLILTFPTAIFFKVHAHYRHELVFFWRFSRPIGVRIMHQCTLFNPKYGTVICKPCSPIKIVFVSTKRNFSKWPKHLYFCIIFLFCLMHILVCFFFAFFLGSIMEMSPNFVLYIPRLNRLKLKLAFFHNKMI
jgi:hypothetical protein